MIKTLLIIKLLPKQQQEENNKISTIHKNNKSLLSNNMSFLCKHVNKITVIIINITLRTRIDDVADCRERAKLA